MAAAEGWTITIDEVQRPASARRAGIRACDDAAYRALLPCAGPAGTLPVGPEGAQTRAVVTEATSARYHARTLITEVNATRHLDAYSRAALSRANARLLASIRGLTLAVGGDRPCRYAGADDTYTRVEQHLRQICSAPGHGRMAAHELRPLTSPTPGPRPRRTMFVERW
jgi:hypothetical protein